MVLVVDERLRRLQRVAEARPDDLEAGRAYALALEQAGDRVAAWSAWCRLGREGDPEAWGHIDRRPTSLRAEPTTIATRTLASPDRRPAYCWVAADRGALVLLGHGALDPVDLSTRWPIAASPGARPIVSGPRVCLAAPAAATVHDLHTGALLGRCPMPAGESPMIEDAMASGDRAFVRWRDFRSRGETRLLTIDLDDRPGAVVADVAVDGGLMPDLAAGGRLLHDDQRDEESRGVTACHVGSGQEVWTAAGRLIAADACGVLMTEWTYDDDATTGPLSELDAATGEVRWSIDDIDHGRTLFTATHVVCTSSKDPYHGRGPEDDVFCALGVDRRTGRVAWELEERIGWHVVLGAAASADAAYIALGSVERGAGPPIVRDPRLMALDLASGSRLFEQRLAVPDDWSTSRSRGLELVVVPAALIVLSTSGRETRVERWS